MTLSVPKKRPISRRDPMPGRSRARSNAVRSGFTVVELLVVMTLIGVLLALALPGLGRARLAAKRIECRNNLRNIALGLHGFEAVRNRLPASGNYFDGGDHGATHHTWAVSILPFVDQQALADQWNLDKPITDPVNEPLTRTRIPVFLCPVDLSRSPPKKGGGDLSYAVNGGVGFTYKTGAGVGDCPMSPFGGNLDLNGNGKTCTADPKEDGTPSDRMYFKWMGLFFLENWKSKGTDRHHALADVKDGTSQTFMVSENARTGYDPERADSTFANSNPYLCAFYVGVPCRNASCSPGNVDYSLSNQGRFRINSGITDPEGTSPLPNSFHEGGVNMAFADGHVAFLSDQIDGAVYAALASPQGLFLSKTPLEEVIVSDGAY